MAGSRSQPDLFSARTLVRDGGGEVELVGTVARITFRSEDTGYTVARVAPEGDEKTWAVVGKMPSISVGEPVRVRGKWVEHPKFGRQLEVTRLERRAPATNEAIVRYLSSISAGGQGGTGVGPKLAERIVQTFGADTLAVIEDRPEELTRVSGVSAKKARALAVAVRESVRLRDLTLLLEENGLGARYAARIQDRYGESALNVVREDPYRLAREIWGIGFVRADALARSLGKDPEDPDRIDAGLTHALRRSADLGDVYVPAEELVRAAEELLQVDTVVVERGLESAVESGRVRREADRVYGISLHRSECDSAELLADMLGETSDPLPFDEGRLRRLQRDRGVTLSPGQIEAVRLAHDRHVLVLTGGPGTGKTTLTRFLLDLFEELGLRLGLAAPTGRAARRLAEATGREASTLHRLLAFDPQTSEFSRDASDPLDLDVLLVDEASMVDQWLFANLLRALPTTARLVLVGDADQLPSVGPGEVLRDLIKSGVVPTARLDRIFRQGERSGIVENAHRILAGDWPEAAEFGQGDFVFLERDRPEDVAQTIREYVSRHLPATGLDPRRDIQVLVPMYKGEAGADALNRALQSDLNAKGREARLGARTFREGDRVIQLRNDYTRNVFNGEIGHVEQVREEGRTLAVRFDSMVELGGSEWDQLALAYAITVHKSQGSEYDWVVFPLTTQHAILLERPLFYTAVTRARKGVLLVGSRRALALALRTGRSRERRTTLAARLRGDLTL